MSPSLRSVAVVVVVAGNGTREIWKPIKGFTGYEVSNLGHIRSLKYGYPLRMATQVTVQGYVRVPLRRDGKYSGQFVHKLVLEAFKGKRPKGHICRWKNDLRSDNRAVNLSWVLRKTAGVVAHPNGKEPTMAKLTRKQVCEIYRSEGGLREIAERYDVSTHTIWRIRTGRSWTSITEGL